MQLTANFNESEFQCLCGNCHKVDIPQYLADVLQDIRDQFNQSIIITSGYRCPAHNKSIGGAMYSKHQLAIAADIQVKGTPAVIVYDYINAEYPNTFGLGLYKTFIHIDIRREKARWGYL